MWTKCSHCEFSTWLHNVKRFYCSKELEPSKSKRDCVGYRCSEYDKVDGTKSKKSHCFICGRPIYTRGTDVPVYCHEHRAYALKDDEILGKAPKELLCRLIAGVFLRAREDYIYNTDGMERDAEIFFKSQWAQTLSLDGFNVEKLLAILEKEKNDESE